MSLIALRKEPRGFAIAGTVIGVLGSVYLVWMGMWVVYGMLELAKTAGTISDSVATMNSANHARDAIVAARNSTGSLPSEAEAKVIVSGFTDAWQTPLRYQPVDGAFAIVSAGEDRQFETADDVTFSPAHLGLTAAATTTTAPAEE